MALDQPRRPHDISRSQGVTHRIVDEPLFLMPAGRFPVQFEEHLGVAFLQACAEEMGEQVVEAPPAPHLVQGHEERVRLSPINSSIA